MTQFKYLNNLKIIKIVVDKILNRWYYIRVVWKEQHKLQIIWKNFKKVLDKIKWVWYNDLAVWDSKAMNRDNLRLNSTHNPEKILDYFNNQWSFRITTFRFEQNLKPLKNSRSVKTDAS